jgi:ABC-type branched-subunit amino acid transport system ATPase component
MPERILEVAALSKRFGGFVALDAVSLNMDQGERLGLIGPNGSGKTTLINCISGALPCDSGRVLYKGRDVTCLPAHQRVRLGIARSFQIPRPFRSMPGQHAQSDAARPHIGACRGQICEPVCQIRRRHIGNVPAGPKSVD